MRALFQQPSSESDKAIDSFLKDISKEFEDIYESVKKAILKEITVKKGKVQHDDDLINSIRKAVIEATDNTDYQSKVLKYIESAKDVGAIEIKINKQIGNSVSSDITNRLLNTTGFFKYGLTEGGYEVNVVNGLQKVLYRGLYNNISVLELMDNVAAFFDAKDNTGDLYKYLRQTAQDTIYRYRGNLNAGIAEEVGANGIVYTPNIIVEKSRPICKHILEKYDGTMTNEQLELLLKKANKDPKGLGQGLVENTKTVSDFIKNRGGYNCNHLAYGTII